MFLTHHPVTSFLGKNNENNDLFKGFGAFHQDILGVSTFWLKKTNDQQPLCFFILFTRY